MNRSFLALLGKIVFASASLVIFQTAANAEESQHSALSGQLEEKINQEEQIIQNPGLDEEILAQRPTRRERRESNSLVPSAVANAVIQNLSQQTGIEASTLRIVEAKEQTWTDGCLGLGSPGLPCSEGRVPGWEVVVGSDRSPKQSWVYRTNTSGTLVKLDIVATQSIANRPSPSETSGETASRTERQTTTSSRRQAQPTSSQTGTSGETASRTERQTTTSSRRQAQPASSQTGTSGETASRTERQTTSTSRRQAQPASSQTGTSGETASRTERQTTSTSRRQAQPASSQTGTSGETASRTERQTTTTSRSQTQPTRSQTGTSGETASRTERQTTTTSRSQTQPASSQTGTSGETASRTERQTTSSSRSQTQPASSQTGTSGETASRTERQTTTTSRSQTQPASSQTGTSGETASRTQRQTTSTSRRQAQPSSSQTGTSGETASRTQRQTTTSSRRQAQPSSSQTGTSGETASRTQRQTTSSSRRQTEQPSRQTTTATEVVSRTERQTTSSSRRQTQPTGSQTMTQGKGEFSLAVWQPASNLSEAIARISVKSKEGENFSAERYIGDYRYRVNQTAKFVGAMNPGDRVVVRLYNFQNRLIGYSEFEVLPQNTAVNLILGNRPLVSRVVRTVYGVDTDRNGSIDSGTDSYDYYTIVSGRALADENVTFLTNLQEYDKSWFQVAGLPVPPDTSAYPSTFASISAQTMNIVTPTPDRGTVIDIQANNTYNLGQEAVSSTQQATRTGGEPTPSETQVSFPDVPSDYWAKRFIAELAVKGILQGYPDGLYRPKASLTRAEFATIISGAFKKDKSREVVAFRDVPTNHWAYPAIRDAYEMGFLEADSSRNFRPDQKITRLDVLVALARGLNYSPSGATDKILQVYTDAAYIPRSDRTMVAAVTERDMVVNYPNVRSLNPNRQATRAEVAALIYRALVSTGTAADISSPYLVEESTAQQTTREQPRPTPRRQAQPVRRSVNNNESRRIQPVRRSNTNSYRVRRTTTVQQRSNTNNNVRRTSTVQRSRTNNSYKATPAVQRTSTNNPVRRTPAVRREI